MSEVDQREGRRRAVPPPRKRRVPRPPEGTSRALWLVGVLVATGVLVAVQVGGLPTLVREVAAGALVTLLAIGLASRTGGRPLWTGLLVAALAAAAFVSDWTPLLAGAGVATAVLAGTLAVMGTVPSPTYRLAIREALIATGVATVGAIGVRGFGAGHEVPVDVGRFGYAVLAIALLGAMVLVYRLGAGLHGLGRRGYALAGGALVLLAVALAYSAALSQWGSPELISLVDSVRDWFTTHLHAVPHPIAALLGYPALAWGVFMRARRRQGWWVCAFGVAATATAATPLVDPAVSLRLALLGSLYSLVVGLFVGYLAVRVEQSVTGSHGRRARRFEEAAAHRPEPGRLRPLH